MKDIAKWTLTICSDFTEETPEDTERSELFLTFLEDKIKDYIAGQPNITIDFKKE